MAREPQADSSAAELAAHVARELSAVGTTTSARALGIALDVATLAHVLALLELER